MFGWEFPPHILGGLGTASYGLTKGMSQQEDMEITFCIPKPWGDEDQSFLRIIGMNSTPIVWRDVDWEYVKGRVGSYMDPQLYFDLRDHIYADFNYLNANIYKDFFQMYILKISLSVTNLEMIIF